MVSQRARRLGELTTAALIVAVIYAIGSLYLHPNISADTLSAIASLSAAIVALFVAFLPSIASWINEPSLEIDLQKKDEAAFVDVVKFNNYDIRWLKIWLKNTGSTEAKNCRVRMKIDRDLQHLKDATFYVNLPVYILYRPEMSSVEVDGKRYEVLRAPHIDEMSIPIPARSQEAFDLIQYNETQGHCDPYSKVGYPLLGGQKFYFEIVAFADGITPTDPMVYAFEWDGTTDGFNNALTKVRRSGE
jgi:hypothetical protein